MFTEMSCGENGGEIMASSSEIDLDFSIGKLSVSPVPYEPSCVRADESSAAKVTSDVSAADDLSALDSISFAEPPEPRNDVAKNAIRSDTVGSICGASLPGQRTDEGRDTSRFDSSDFVRIAEPSILGDGEAEAVDEIDETRKSNHHLNVYASSPRNTAHNSNTELSQDIEFQLPSRNCRTVAQKDSISDLKSLQISRRRRSLFSKRPRSSVWGFLSLPAFEKHSGLDSNSGNGKKKWRVRGGQGKRNAIRDQTGRKSVGKSCTATGRISLKIKIGNQSCGMVNITEKINASRKSVSSLHDIAKTEFEKELPGKNERKLEKVVSSDASVLGTHSDITGSVQNASFSALSYPRQIVSHEEGDNLRVSTGNQCSDPGTSPDSEVINSVPDAPLYEKCSQYMQDSPIMPMERRNQEFFSNCGPDVSFGGVSSLSFPKMKSRKGKKKDKHYQCADCTLENKVTGAETKHNVKASEEPGPSPELADVSKCDDAFIISTAKPFLNTHSSDKVSSGPEGCSKMTNLVNLSITSKKLYSDAEGNPSSGLADATDYSNSQTYDSLIPCSNVEKFPKCSRAKERCKSRSGILDLPNKKGKASKKKGDKRKLIVKLQIDKKDDASGVLNGVESHLAAENQTSYDLGETGDVRKASSGPINSLLSTAGWLEGQYIPPRNAWVLCDKCQKWRRIAASLADQIEETNCGWACNDNTDKDFADCSIPQEKSNSEINEELEISDASCDEDARETLGRSSRNQSNAAQQSSWSLIKSNLFLNRSRKTQTVDEVMVCHCEPPSNGGMGCGSKCLNRMLNIECVQGTCPCGQLCSNQKFQQRKYAKLKWFRCGKKGFGIQVLEDISEGLFLIEYVGEVLDIRAYEARQREYALQGHKHFYFMTLNGSEVIDACAKGNLARFINHSCDPNCRTEKWMVNGEVCVGLFAIRDIKKDEELTFDYNYVRVFGAAAKKCVCGSANCRGYIGGDLTNSEVIVQGDSDDDYAEPVMVCEDREMKDDWNEIMSHSLHKRENESANELRENRYRTKKLVNAAVPFKSMTSETLIQKVGVSSTSADGCFETSTATRVVDMTVRDKYEPDNSVGNNFACNASVGPSDTNKDTGESLNSSASATFKVESEGVLSPMCSPVKLTDVSFQSEGIMSSTMSADLHFAHGLETSITAVPSKLGPDTIESKRKLKYDTMGGKEELAKSNSLAKARRSSSSIKKGKPKSNVMNDKETLDGDKSITTPHKSKKLPELSLNSHVEAVEEKLNELLDTEGGISKRKDASRGYLKLLFLTAAFGTYGHGEAIQSNRDLSMILDALLKTKSRTVLVDIINKNGLQMLHNIIKRYRKEFIKTPILRKLLKVLEYLAMREILTLEHIAGGPACPGVESFKDSILTLTEHADKQVHQIARNFRDRWIPRSLRKNFFMEMDDGKMKFHQRSSYSKLSVSCNRWSYLEGKPVECGGMLTAVASGVVETSTLDHSSASGCSYGINGTRTHKRKSRWDNLVEEYMHPRIRTSLLGDGKPNIDDDIPPGFSSPCDGSTVPAIASSTAVNRQNRDAFIKHPFGIVLANPQERFIARLPVSYGVPSTVMEQFGIIEADAAKVWVVAPGLPFHPFPPLPSYANNGGDPQTSTAKCASFSEPAEKADLDNVTCVASHSCKKRKMTCSLDTPEMNISRANEQPDLQREVGSLGRKYSRLQKSNHSRLVPPWVRMRNGWGHAGNSRNVVPGVGFGNGASQKSIHIRGS